jgi:hypothetical protein
MPTNHTHELAPYATSRDYARLAELAKAHSVICILTHREYRDVARTTYMRTESGMEMWQVSGRGIGYVWTDDLDDFARECEKVELEFIEPSSKVPDEQ